MKSTLIRPGMTAIAAVIALSSTPLLAQDATPQTTAPSVAPVQVTPPTVVPTVPSTVVPPTATTVTPQPATPVIETAPVVPAPVIAVEPVEAAPAPVATPERAAPTRAAAPRPAARSQRSAAPAPAAPVEAQPVTPPAAVEAAPAPLPVEATPAPVEQAAPAPVATAEGNDMLPLIGAGALAVLALGAAGFALSRRRRRDDDVAEEWETVEAESMMAAAQPAPVMAATPDERPLFAWNEEAAPAPVAAGPATLPNGFDISRHGRHVQAAYRGPTPDNPFVSLKKRLTRAHFYDMQEARAAEAGAAATPRPAAPAPQPVQDRFEVRSPARGNVRTGGFRPAFQN